jgi:hypothetical protein
MADPERLPAGYSPNYYAAEYPVALNQPPGVIPAGLIVPTPALAGTGRDESTDIGEDAPFSAQHVSRAPVGQALPAQSPLYQQAQPPVKQGTAQDTSYAGRLQEPIGFSGGTYALNTEFDAGSPVDKPEEALPGLRDGEYQFSARLRNLGDQGVMDKVLQQGGSFLSVNQPPWWGDDRPAGR